MEHYDVTSKMQEQLERSFTYHSPKNDQNIRYMNLRAMAKELALQIVRSTPPSREQSLAITELEACIFWANAAIARNE